MPDDFKSMSGIGPGVHEIRIRDASGAFRVIYVVRFEEAIYVLHAFQKKTQKTAPLDIELARQRYRALLEDRR
jgi:phage-related protein